jgi:rhodanese-related sulfurtransferase
MDGSLVFYIVFGLFLLFYVRRFFAHRSIPHYSPGEVEEKLSVNRGVFLLDVRTEKEWRQGHIKGAHHIPLHELGRRFSELEKHKSKEIICYCQTGNRSVAAAVRLKRMGYTAASMQGGIGEWNFQKRG